ncbi:hypothetical protein PspLS_03399 [Pyricularia sp. CBS 133598]|nr:hypothetical protein PspLS_03399 [Pyricularia sp. CBS 133598]
MLPQTFLLVIAAARAANSLAIQSSQLSELQPATCLPSTCGRNGSIVCYNDEQYCHAESDQPNYVGASLGLPCRNETVSPKYPITKVCEESKLAPYDKNKIPSECLNTLCAAMDGKAEGLWCLYFPEGWTGLQYKKLGMECDPSEGR